MSDSQTPDVTPEAAPVAAGDDAARLAILEKELRDARQEAAKYRRTLRDQEAAQEDAKRKQAEEQGEYRKLYEEQQRKAAELEARLVAAELHRTQLSVAQELGLPPVLAERLRGDGPAELRKDAEALLAAIKAIAQPAQAAAAPTVAPVVTIPATNPQAQRGAKITIDPKNPPRLGDIPWKV
jgi:hypothetical protein